MNHLIRKSDQFSMATIYSEEYQDEIVVVHLEDDNGMCICELSDSRGYLDIHKDNLRFWTEVNSVTIGK